MFLKGFAFKGGLPFSPRFFSLGMIYLMLVSCIASLNVNDPVDLVWDKMPGKSESLIVFLPGLYDEAERFEEEEFFTIARKAGIQADMVAASIHVGHFVNHKMIERIEKDIFQSLAKEQYKNIWFVGLSLGGLNSLTYYRSHEKDLCGVVVLAPFLLNKRLAKKIENVEGVKVWMPNLGEYDAVIEKRIETLWVWLREKEDLSKIYLGYGDKDIYVSSHKVLANLLDKNNVLEIKGKHTWKYARKIWQQQLLSRKETGLLQPCH